MITLDQAELAVEATDNSFRLLFPTDIHKGGIECLSDRHTHTKWRPQYLKELYLIWMIKKRLCNKNATADCTNRNHFL